MKEPITQNEKFIDTELKIMHEDNGRLTQEVKILERRMDFLQDENARIVLEQQAMIKSMRVFTKIANELIEKETTTKPSGKPDESGIQ